MQIEFDPAKDTANLAKHGVSLALASHLDWDTVLATADERSNYGEPRMIGFATHDTRVYCIVFTNRADVRRIISLRKANDREVRHYVTNI